MTYGRKTRQYGICVEMKVGYCGMCRNRLLDIRYYGIQKSELKLRRKANSAVYRSINKLKTRMKSSQVAEKA